jgi:hypothetical protein
MSRYCFIIPRTPEKYDNAFRKALWKICRQSLINQRETSWTALIIGKRDSGERDERFVYLEEDLLPKADKIRLGLDYALKMQGPPPYVIRLDDDDVISETVLAAHAEKNFDCLYDARHTFYEICSARISMQKRNWYPNTIVHKIEHAAYKIPWKEKKEYLLCTDHSATWHTYYSGKHCISTDGNEPLYMRILSPFSITSRAAITEKAFVSSYISYLSGFGAWSVNRKSIKGLDNSLDMLLEIGKARELYGLPQVRWPLWKLFIGRLRAYKEGW